MNWYLQSEKESDVVLSTRVRFARNLINYKFSSKLLKEDAENLIQEIRKAIQTSKLDLKILNLKEMDDITKLSLVEKHIISPEFVLGKNDSGAIAINDEENICIMINEEDHLRIQVLSSGLELENVLNLILEIDDKIRQYYKLRIS